MFNDMRLPESVARFVVSHPVFDVVNVQTRSGANFAKLRNAHPTTRYIIKDARLNFEQFQSFYAFFRNCCGSAYSFRIKDPLDYAVQYQKAHVVLLSNGKKIVPLTKVYSDVCITYSKPILYPMQNTLLVTTVNDQKIENVSISTVSQQDNTKCDILLPDNLEEAIIKYSVEFDTIVRFADNSFTYKHDVDGSVVLDEIILIEVRYL